VKSLLAPTYPNPLTRNGYALKLSRNATLLLVSEFVPESGARLRVLVANERHDRLAAVAATISELGYEVIAPQIEVTEVGAVTAREQPDVAFVGLGESSDHALEMIERIVHEATCPVIVLLHEPDLDFVNEAARRGVFAHITDGDPRSWQNSIRIALSRFAQLQDLEGAFRSRTVIERAKGILMERHSLDELSAAGKLRDLAEAKKGTLAEAAHGVVDGTFRLSEV
jgi:AmiR/NasT family two-component response regulator